MNLTRMAEGSGRGRERVESQFESTHAVTPPPTLAIPPGVTGTTVPETFLRPVFAYVPQWSCVPASASCWIRRRRRTRLRAPSRRLEHDAGAGARARQARVRLERGGRHVHLRRRDHADGVRGDRDVHAYVAAVGVLRHAPDVNVSDLATTWPSSEASPEFATRDANGGV